VPLEKLDIDRRRLSAKTVQEFCEQRMRQLLDTIFVDEPTIRLVLRDARGLDHVVEKVITEIDGLLLEALEREIRAGQKLGVLGPGDPVFLARHNLGAIEKVVLTALARDPEPLDLDAVVRDTVRVQLFGMLAKEVRCLRGVATGNGLGSCSGLRKGSSSSGVSTTSPEKLAGLRRSVRGDSGAAFSSS